MWKPIIIGITVAGAAATAVVIHLHISQPADNLAAELLSRMDAKEAEIAANRQRVLEADRNRDEALRRLAGVKADRPKIDPLPIGDLK